MKYFIPIFLISNFLFPTNCFSQRNKFDNKIEKYSLDFPKKWLNKNIIYAVSNVIDSKIPYLKDKQLCVECNSVRYKISLFISPINKINQVIDNVNNSGSDRNNEKNKDYYNCNTVYNFNSYIYVSDELMKTNEKIILVDSSEHYHIERRFSVNNGQTYYKELSSTGVAGNNGYNNEGNHFENSNRQIVLDV